ncbi:hypothetical protein GCM10027445_31470 [Amycolatopsis endophytica]|uniref:Secreted protein n=1 Tax=Amycolatopsis endophytica TaxID=860233 RepID=A0A853B1W7_9PSEU|nr:hypothetical protein [Amycolatopsis endophytica]NYI88771.1 hypothetical protein [Amycolatopsis endophytica]
MVRRLFTATLISLAVVACSSDDGEQADPIATPPPSSSGDASIVQVAYRNGQVDPANVVVQGKVGQPIQVNVTSDRADDIVVDAYPDANADVDPTEPEDIDVTPSNTGTFTIRLRAANATLVTVEVR